MNPEYNKNNEKSCLYWKTKYYKMLHKYLRLLNQSGVHHLYNNDSDDDDEDDNDSHNSDDNNYGYPRVIKNKIPLGPPLIPHPMPPLLPPEDMSRNAPRVIHIYSHPLYIHRDISMNTPHHIYPHPIPIHHSKPIIMPQNAHIPPPNKPKETKETKETREKYFPEYPYYFPYYHYGNPYYGNLYCGNPYYLRELPEGDKPPKHPVLQSTV